MKIPAFLYYQNECFDVIICVTLGRNHQCILNCKGLFNILIFYIYIKMAYLNGDIF